MRLEPLIILLFKFIFIYKSMCGYMYMCAGAQRVQGCWLPQVLELQKVVSFLIMLVLGIKLVSYGRAVCVLNNILPPH